MRARATAMVQRVAAEARARLPSDEAHFVTACLSHSLEYRDGRIRDDHDTRLLHPARTIRILLADTACDDAAVLAAAAFVDSLDTDLVPEPGAGPLEHPAAHLGSSAARSVHAHTLLTEARARLTEMPILSSDAAQSLEALVVAPRRVATAALAERLDQVRHVHLRRDQPWQKHLDDARAAWIPAARRIAPPLAARFERWADAFERRVVLGRRSTLP